MKKQEQKLVPKLRFPEFLGEWVETSLQEQVCYENGKAHENEIDAQGQYVVVNSKFISTDGEIRKFTNQAYCLARRNDILMVLSDVPNGKAIAKCFYVDEDKKYTVNQRICRLTSINDNSGFLFFIINKNSYFLSFDDGVKQTNLRKEDVLSCPLIIPQKIEEQQKIADCLTTLDEKINAQSQKIEQLKAHKKGLMQKLFPAEGQNVPSLRFPEFAEAGAWKHTFLFELFSFKYGIGNTNPSDGGIYPVYGANGIIGGYSKYNAENSFIIGHMGVYAGSVFWEKEKHFVTYNGTITTLKDENLLNLGFAYYALIKLDINKRCHGLGYIFLSYDMLNELKILIPIVEEQEKIAGCILSLDTLLEKHCYKLELLKEYKKGLMQKMFA